MFVAKSGVTAAESHRIGVKFGALLTLRGSERDVLARAVIASSRGRN